MFFSLIGGGKITSNKEENVENYVEHVKKQIEKKNPWYIQSQFAWAEKESIKRAYNRRRQFFFKIIKREISKKGNITLLDYGCGDGYWALFFSRFLDCKLVGVDYNPLRLKRAKSVVKKAQFIEADLRLKNEHIGKYDIVFCSMVIEHVENDIFFLKNIKNHLKQDGLLILGTSNEGSLLHRFKRSLLHKFKRSLFHRFKSRNKIRKTDHVQFYTEKEIKSKIREAGFKITRTFREVFFPGFERLYYKFTSTDIGFKLLELLIILFPSQCSGYYFECKKR